MHLAKPVVGIAPTPDGKGYWLVAADGGVFTFGDAPYEGSLPGQHITPNKPISGIAGGGASGYWLVGQDGGVYSFNVPFYGSAGSQTLNAPITAIAATSDHGGYWLVGQDGGVFTDGDAPFHGALPPTKPNLPVDGIAIGPSQAGYWLGAQDGGVFTFGSIPFYGAGKGQCSPPGPNPGVGLYSASQLQSSSDWTAPIDQGWAGLLDTEALGSESYPYTALEGNADLGVQQALMQNPSYKGFWVSYWTVDAPDPSTGPSASTYYQYGYAAGSYAANHEKGLGGSRLPDYMAIDYEGFYAPQSQTDYVQETQGWADGIHSVLPGMRIIFYTSGQSVYTQYSLNVISSAMYQASVVFGYPVTVPATGNVIGYQGLYATCSGGTAAQSVNTVAGWGPVGRGSSQVEFSDGRADCAP